MSELAPFVAATLRDKVVLEQQEEIERLNAIIANKEKENEKGRILITGKNACPVYYECTFDWSTDIAGGGFRDAGKQWTTDDPLPEGTVDHLVQDEHICDLGYEFFSESDNPDYDADVRYSLKQKSQFPDFLATMFNYYYERSSQNHPAGTDLLHDGALVDQEMQNKLSAIGLLELHLCRGESSHPCCAVGNWTNICVEHVRFPNPMFPNQNMFSLVNRGQVLGFPSLRIRIKCDPNADAETRKLGSNWRIEGVSFDHMSKSKCKSKEYLGCNDLPYPRTDGTW